MDKLKSHNRNQRKMYRIHKQEEKIHNLELLIGSLEQENKELKKQLEELQTLYNNMFKCHCNRVQVETLLSQQKEFIEYLEGEIKRLEENNIYEPLQKMALETFKHILSKYKETIEGKNGN